MRVSIILLLMMGLNLRAQILDEDAQVLNKAGGEAVFQLNSGERLYSYEPEDGWYKIRKEVWVNAGDLIDEKYLNAGTVLYNKTGEKTGEVMQEVRVKDKRKVEPFRGNDRFVVILEGYIYKTKIEAGSVPEERLTQLLAVKNRTEQFAGFEELFRQYNFEERIFEDLTVYVMREENKTADAEKDFRLIVVFRGETSLYGIITNDHQVSAPKIKDEYTDLPFRIIYFYKPTAAQKQLIEDIILYTYLAL